MKIAALVEKDEQYGQHSHSKQDELRTDSSEELGKGEISVGDGNRDDTMSANNPLSKHPK